MSASPYDAPGVRSRAEARAASSSPRFVPVAVVGLACRFPGAANSTSFWRNLRDGVSSIRHLTDAQLRAHGVTQAELDAPGYVRACALLEDIDKFDAAYFGLSPREASVMDPAHRFFLEVAHHALEHAGYAGQVPEAAVGVFASSGAPTYLLENLRNNPELMRSVGAFLVRHTGNDMNFLATRASYALDLRGPSLNVQTACSSSLVAVHLACQSLARGECELAIAGGSTIVLPMGHGYVYAEGEVLSPDGQCRPFDADAAGTVFGSGTGCVVLKLLDRALDDGDTIHAVIRGSAINNDGALKVGYLAPGVEGQAAAIRGALAAGGIDARSVSYVEAHGTGTRVGDPIEVAALAQAFGPRPAAGAYCALGSVKSNIGHLGEAAGIASLIKAVLALSHRELPPTLGFRAPNPELALSETPFFVQAALTPWRAAEPLRCGVGALGVGGTNCHVILEQAPAPLPGEGARSLSLLMLSAKRPEALAQLGEELAQHLSAQPAICREDAAYTLAVGRRTHAHRCVLVARDVEDAVRKLRRAEAPEVHRGRAEEQAPEVVFMFPGAGPQHRGMGAELYAHEAPYRDALEACIALAERELGAGALRPLLTQAAGAHEPLARPALALPALFAMEYALAQLYLSWGVTPSALIGHSMGEYVAACLAEIMTLAEAMQLVILRARLSESVGAGAMLSVALPEAEARALCPELDLAAVNAPALCVLSGRAEAITRLEQRLVTDGVDCARLHIELAAHSQRLDPVLPTFREACRRIALKAPKLRVISCLTGAPLTAAQACDPEYWVRHFRGTVQFARAIEGLLDVALPPLFLELGPGRGLSTLVRAHGTRARHVIASMRQGPERGDELASALLSYGRLWSAGAALDIEALYDGQLRNRVPLPGYPFARTRHWIEPSAPAAMSTQLTARPLEAWFQQVVFREAPLARANGRAAPRRWLLLTDDPGTAKQLAKRLPGDTYVVTPGKWMQKIGSRHYEIEPQLSACYEELLGALLGEGFAPDHVVYAFDTSRSLLAYDARSHRAQLARALHGPLFLARVLGRHGEPVQLSVVTHGLSDIDGGRLRPLAATVLGPVLVTPREYPNVRTRVIDLRGPLGSLGRAGRTRLGDELIAESDEQVVALREGARWARAIVPARLPEVPRPRAWLRPDSVVLVTGGLGGIALEVCLHMARARSLKLALVSRTASDAGARDPSSPLAQRLRKLETLRALGAEVLVISADVADLASMRGVVAQVRARFGRIDGVLHAAGVLDDELMETRSLPAIDRVLAPKLGGTLVLDQLLTEPLDFFVIFSSVASLVGLPGQIDYTAANAFLDAFARERARRSPGVTKVINWSAWREVGMTVAALRRERTGCEPTHRAAHPALDGWARTPSGGSVFLTTFSVARHWLLDEHRILGAWPLLPGTAFVELARAAAATAGLEGPLELCNVQFLTPFQVAPESSRRLRIALTPLGTGFEITMSTLDETLSADHAPAHVREPAHVLADVRRLERTRVARLDLATVSGRCTREVDAPPGGMLQQSFLALGPRWASLHRVHVGEGEALLELRLPARFADDLRHYALHPALLDMATGGAQRLIRGADLARDFYVPLGYGSIRVHAPLTPHLFSHVRCSQHHDATLAYFDVTLTDPDGRVLVEIARFTMKRIDASSALRTAPSRGDARKQRAPSPLDAVLRTAIAPAEGVDAFERIMAQSGLTQVVASSVDLCAWQAQLDAEAARTRFERPGLQAEPLDDPDYVAPESAGEQLLAGIWSELLGVARVSVRADFFELGGSSLLAVRLFARIKKHFGVALPLSTLFEAPTIRALAALLGEDPAIPAPAGSTRVQGYVSLVPMQPKGTRPPFYCAAGMHGNPLNLRLLAAHSGPDQPFFGLQPQGLDGAAELHRSVPDMAAHYLREVRRHQPRGPYYLGGYSGGGIVAFEMARQLTEAGEEVGALVLLDSPAPTLPLRGHVARVKLHLARFEQMGRAYPARVAAQVLEAKLGRAKLLAQRKLSRVLPELRFRYRLEEIAEAWFEAAGTYRPSGYEGPALLLRAEAEGSEVQGTARIIDHQNGWGAYVFGGLEVRDVPGDHTTMCEEPNVRVLARHLRAYLDRCMSARRSPIHAPTTAVRSPGDLRSAGELRQRIA